MIPQEAYPISYRDNVARYLRQIRHNPNFDAPKLRDMMRQTAVFEVADRLHRATRSPLASEKSSPAIRPLTLNTVRPRETFTPSGISTEYNFQTSNEYYGGLAERLQSTGGTGIAVGSDQGLDLFIMADLEIMHIIDVDPQTILLTRAYLELGKRLHDLLGHYPTTEEYISFFSVDHQSVLLDLLSVKHTKFNKKAVKDLEKFLLLRIGIDSIENYLSLKGKELGKSSWIGTDENLEKVIKAYETGRITVHNDNIVEDSVRDFITQVKPSIMYVSNVPEFLGEDETKNTINSWRERVDQDALVIFSSRNIKDLQAANVPKAMQEILRNWVFILFHLKDGWPQDVLKESVKIGNGCYEIVSNSMPPDRRNT